LLLPVNKWYFYLLSEAVRCSDRWTGLV
jgi:hypothetical protein